MKRGRLVLVAASAFILPHSAFAQVVISEVMYNPAGSDNGREWIELYNAGQSDVAMTGGSGKGSWRINDGSNHTLVDPAGGTGRGSLTIPAGGYLIVASDPSEFISGEYAGGPYSVVKSSLTLNNNGSTITLLDGTGATVDTVSYTPPQGGSDDGSSLQRQADGSWIAATPTPGAANSASPYVASQSTGTPASDASSSTSLVQPKAAAQSTVDSYVPPPMPSLYANAGHDRSVIVGADVEFDASAYDKTQILLDPGAVRFMWNFGDGTAAEGGSVLHHFSYPGTYAVVLEIAKNKNAAAAQIVVIAQPAALSFSLLSDGGVEIKNLAGRDLDLSDWIVRENESAFAAQFMLPESSKALSGSSIRIPPQTLTFRASSSTVLEYPNGVVALTVGQSSATTSTLQPQATLPTLALQTTKRATPKRDAPISTGQDARDNAVSSEIAASDGSQTIEPDPAPVLPQIAAAASSSHSEYMWWIGIIALALAAGATLAAATHFKRGEWDIVEDDTN